MEITKYDFCGCIIELISEEPIEQEGNFSMFRTDSGDADYSFRVIKQDNLPGKTGELLTSPDRRTIYSSDGKKRCYTSYYDSKRSAYIEYGCRTDNELYISSEVNLRELPVFDALDLPSLLLEKETGILHCSFIEHNGEAILFSGKNR